MKSQAITVTQEQDAEVTESEDNQRLLHGSSANVSVVKNYEKIVLSAGYYNMEAGRHADLVRISVVECVKAQRKKLHAKKKGYIMKRIMV